MESQKFAIQLLRDVPKPLTLTELRALESARQKRVKRQQRNLRVYVTRNS